MTTSSTNVNENIEPFDKFFEAVFGEGATDGDVAVCRSDDATLTSRDLDEIEEFIAGAPGEAWVSLQTRAPDGTKWEQPAVCGALYETAPLPPSIVLRHKDGDLFGVFLVDTIGLRGKTTLPEELTESCPLPVGPWSVVASHPDRTYDLETVTKALVEPAPGNVVPLHPHVTYSGTPDPALLAMPVPIAFSPVGKETKPGRWRNMKDGTLAHVVNLLIAHPENKEKDGWAIAQGSCIGGKKIQNAMDVMYLPQIDFDKGADPARILQWAEREGVFMVLYTTHSHGATESEFPQDKVIKASGIEATPDTAAVRAYMRTKRIEESIIESAELDRIDHKPAGVTCIVRHKPWPKYRALLALKNPVRIASRKVTHQAGIAEWRAKYAGLAEWVGGDWDQSCTNLDRLFYTTRHKPGRDFHVWVNYGKAIDYETLPELTKEEVRLRGLDPLERAAEEMRGGKGKDYKTSSLLWFFGKHGSTFDLETFILDNDPDGDRGPRSSGAGRIHRCPTDDSHSDAGNPEDEGFFCVNASDSDTGSAVAHCSHDSCSGLDRVDFVDLICERVGITDATELKKWVPETIEDEEPVESESEEDTASPDKPAHRAYKNYTEAKRSVGNVPADDDGVAAGVVAVRIGMSDLTASETEALKKAWMKHTKIGPKVFGDEVKRGRQLAKDVSKGGEDDHGDEAREELAKLNKAYCSVMVNGHFRIATEPDRRGSMPALSNKSDWCSNLANQKVPIYDGKGNKKMAPITQQWMEWEDRRHFENGIVFRPAVVMPKTPGQYNIWSGFPVVPAKGDWSTLRNHIKDNVCGGVDDYFKFFMTWLSQIIQHPETKMPCALVVKGKKGTGKSKVFDWYRKLFGEHALKLNDTDQLLNGFNKHLMGLLFATAEEAFFAGDIRAMSKLKDIISSIEMLVTLKGIDSTSFDNFMRVAMCSNESWVVPATWDERRFFVLKCGEARQNDTAYFGAIDEQMNGVGLAAMMHDLRTWQPAGWSLWDNKGWDLLRAPIVTPWQREEAAQTATGSPAHTFAEWLVEHAERGIGVNWSYQTPGITKAEGRPDRLDFTEEHSVFVPFGQVYAHLIEYLDLMREGGGSRRRAAIDLKAALPEVLGATREHRREGNGYLFPAFSDMALALANYRRGHGL